MYDDFFFPFVVQSDAAMDTDEGEKEVPAKKAKTDPVVVIHLYSYYKWFYKPSRMTNVIQLKQTICHYYSERTKKKLRRDEACVQATMCQKQSKEITLPPSSMLGESTCNKMLEEGAWSVIHFIIIWKNILFCLCIINITTVIIYFSIKFIPEWKWQEAWGQS